ncbi:hypothetical protein Tcan_00260 [Toxocara canis]|uniref:Uncharacterized protein n=1 Tax=Toxocara canis TaxID=6265 RepID=A0A0B2VAY6_TOXCA|nr:hypothetical protein Tcan_00260 [Toxocara canis]
MVRFCVSFTGRFERFYLGCIWHVNKCVPLWIELYGIFITGTFRIKLFKGTLTIRILVVCVFVGAGNGQGAVLYVGSFGYEFKIVRERHAFHPSVDRQPW